jgi:hypothetical protein
MELRSIPNESCSTQRTNILKIRQQNSKEDIIREDKRVIFADQISGKSGIAEIIQVQSYRRYNKPFNYQGLRRGDNFCNCNIF